jgi:arylsulfatase A-like enzyme
MHRFPPAVTFCVLLCSAALAEKPTPNVVLILTDDQGWTGTSVPMHDGMQDSKSDYYRTPHLERLAARGMRFSNAYAPHSNCSPSRYSILTGKSPAQLHMTDIIYRESGPYYEGNRLNPPRHLNEIVHEEVTIPEWLKRADPRYRTAHFGKWHLAGGGPGEHGFDEHDGATANGKGKMGGDNPKRTLGVSKRAVAFLDRRAEDGAPFYLQVSYYAVHLPILALTESIAKARSRPKGQHHRNHRYAAMTEELDSGIGMVLGRLESSGLAASTLVIFTSDNGASVLPPDVTNNTPLKRGKASVWEGGLRVPTIIAGPGIEPGSLSHVPIVGWDFLPTIARWTDLDGPLPDDLEGGSLVALLTGKATERVKRSRKGLVHHFPHYQHQYGTAPQSSIRLGSYKLIKFWEDGEVELFDLETDVGETVDRKQALPRKTRRMERRLERYLEDVDAQAAEKNPAFDPATDPRVNYRVPG